MASQRPTYLATGAVDIAATIQQTLVEIIDVNINGGAIPVASYAGAPVTIDDVDTEEIQEEGRPYFELRTSDGRTFRVAVTEV